MNRGCCLLAVILLGCGPETWAFDHGADAESLEAAVVPDVVGHRDAVSQIDIDEDSEAADDRPEPEDEDSSMDVAPVPDVATPCTGDSDCSGAAPHCSRDAGVCTRCQMDVDCAGDAGPRVCDTSKGACVECVSSADCSISTNRPYCDTAADRCVQCLSNTNCGFERFCLSATHTCTSMF